MAYSRQVWYGELVLEPTVGKSDSPLKKNNFDLLRLAFAATVCFGHIFELSRMPELSWIGRYLSSAVAVKSFFVVSGFLIFMSYERSSSVSSYLEKRLRRIYPAYGVVILISAFSLYFLSNASPGEYFSLGWIKYLTTNLLFLNFLQPELPMLFESHRYQAVNGALWTLKIEVMFYCCVPFLAYLIRRYSVSLVVLVVYLLSIIYGRLLLDQMSLTANPLYGLFAKQLPGQMCYFIAGAFFFYFYDRIKKWTPLILPAALLVLFFDGSTIHFIIEPFALAAAVVSFAFIFHLGNFARFGDFSYGLYICHFPIIQIFIQSGWFQGKPALFLVSSALCSLAAGVLMCHAVEKRFLLRSSHYRSHSGEMKS